MLLASIPANSQNSTIAGENMNCKALKTVALQLR
jgi:hypothetical protein